MLIENETLNDVLDRLHFKVAKVNKNNRLYLERDDAWLIESIRAMKPGNPLYKLLKEELSKQGHWKGLPRGKPRDFKKE